MPLYRDRVAEELEGKKSEFRGELSREAIEEHTEAADDLSSNFSKKEIEDELEDIDLPGALPTEEFSEYDGIIVPFEESADWSSHEEVNRWARNQLEENITVAADGSQIDPVTQFEQPVGLVQIVRLTNKHSVDKDYEETAETEVLTPEDLLFENPNSGYIQVDEQEVPVSRFEKEMQVLEKKIQELADAGEQGVVMYDGSLILSFTQMFDQKTQKRYSEALTRLLAASKYHEIPVIGYISGSKATELGKMLKKLNQVDTARPVRDYQFLEDLIDNWGSRTVLFSSQRDRTQDKLKAKYRGQEFDFSDDILFTYLDIGPGAQIDRVEMPRWIHENGLTEEVISVVRAEAGVGRGYPEILQAADADAVISRQDREEFLRMYQDFSDENDIELRWNNKALSKKRRRR
ncbi:DNA double-strand break repair nuclease NurA [Haloarcula argentinensis]|uniref:NurA domain-containing protein n=1 Tax=Haloarcula argentinensis TaxID=43776 RepID=A0A847UMU9_HALAR|nr:DNA double-strand break repair nuclease NurA [Haloarcula argentinensis]NLV13220.1 NurA domain-containing protein [Haloarcula argentinensis]